MHILDEAIILLVCFFYAQFNMATVKYWTCANWKLHRRKSEFWKKAALSHQESIIEPVENRYRVWKDNQDYVIGVDLAWIWRLWTENLYNTLWSWSFVTHWYLPGQGSKKSVNVSMNCCVKAFHVADFLFSICFDVIYKHSYRIFSC